MTESVSGYRIPNGRHQGKRITRIPVGYLRWMVNVGHEDEDKAIAELDRRGTAKCEMDVSAHAIDRASQRLLDKWQNSGLDVGLHTWVAGMAKQALEHGKRTENEAGITVKYEGVKYFFEIDRKWPILKSVY